MPGCQPHPGDIVEAAPLAVSNWILFYLSTELMGVDMHEYVKQIVRSVFLKRSPWGTEI